MASAGEASEGGKNNLIESIGKVAVAVTAVVGLVVAVMTAVGGAPAPSAADAELRNLRLEQQLARQEFQRSLDLIMSRRIEGENPTELRNAAAEVQQAITNLERAEADASSLLMERATLAVLGGLVLLFSAQVLFGMIQSIWSATMMVLYSLISSISKALRRGRPGKHSTLPTALLGIGAALPGILSSVVQILVVLLVLGPAFDNVTIALGGDPHFSSITNAFLRGDIFAAATEAREALLGAD